MPKSINLIFALAVTAIFTVLSGCATSTSSDDTTPPTAATVSFTGETEESHASATFEKGSNEINSAGVRCDSLEITRVRFLLSAVKLHFEGREDNDESHDGELNAGPFVAEFVPGASRVYSTIQIPPGIYEKIKFEIHKFPSSIDQFYLNDPIFRDFVTNERSTIIIEGRAWPIDGSAPVPFVYKSHITANLEAKFPEHVELVIGSHYTLGLLFSPLLAFKATYVLDPRDPDNQGDIDKYLRSALHALKR